MYFHKLKGITLHPTICFQRLIRMDLHSPAAATLPQRSRNLTLPQVRRMPAVSSAFAGRQSSVISSQLSVIFPLIPNPEPLAPVFPVLSEEQWPVASCLPTAHCRLPTAAFVLPRKQWSVLFPQPLAPNPYSCPSFPNPESRAPSPGFSCILPATGRRMFQDIKASLQQLYLEDNRPWLASFALDKATRWDLCSS
jgi:hypothetical protein